MQRLHRNLAVSAAVAASWLAFSTPAAAQSSCPSGRICAGAPQTLVNALQAAGYKAKLIKDGSGDPMVEAAAEGYTYYIDFYGCQAQRNCTSLQWNISFRALSKYTPAFTNRWNDKYRFATMSVRGDGSLYIAYDIHTPDGLSTTHLNSILRSWETTLRAFNDYTSEFK